MKAKEKDWEQFLDYFKGYLKILKTNPELFSIKKPPFFRELPLKKFPFVIIYEIFQNEVIIYSVFHTSRNPKKSRKLNKIAIAIEIVIAILFLIFATLKTKKHKL